MSDQPLSEDNNQASYGTNANAPAGPAAPAASRKMQATKAQVDEVVDIMRSNVEAVLERDAKISMMDDRADALHQGASQFETQAAKLKNKFWLENMKYMIALGIVVVIVIAVAVYKYKDTAAELVNSMSSAPKPNPGMYSSGMNQPNTVSPVVDVNSIGPDNAVPVQNPNQYEQQPAPQEPMQSTIQNPEDLSVGESPSDPSVQGNAEAG